MLAQLVLAPARLSRQWGRANHSRSESGKDLSSIRRAVSRVCCPHATKSRRLVARALDNYDGALRPLNARLADRAKLEPGEAASSARTKHQHVRVT